ncbi:HEAT repeat domain-containing protein [bacterium]|nr:HEAT repeat domain-containing protein [bacterium]MBU4561547.1 HEAT repeat domain-containing protein [bacterium]MCG2677797.1 HEAT repeat domain-containing protein [bacterium]
MRALKSLTLGVLILLFWVSNVAPAQVDEIDQLINQLKNENWRMRYEAVQALGRREDPRAAEPLVNALKDKYWPVRYEAAQALGKIGDSRAVEPLITTLQDKYWPVQWGAAQALGKIGDSRAVEPLINALKAAKWPIRCEATQALVKLGTPAVEPLITTLKEEQHYDVRWRAAQALGKIGDSRAVESLIIALKDEKWPVRYNAAQALGEIGDERAIPALEEALKSKNKRGVRKAIIEALEKIKSKKIEEAPLLEIESLPDEVILPEEKEKQPLRLTIKLDKKVYGAWEPIDVKMKLKNTGKEDVLVWKDIFWGDDAIFSVNRIENGKRIPVPMVELEGVRTVLRQEALQVLGSKETFEEEENVLKWVAGGILRPGNYEIQITYRSIYSTAKEIGPKIWTSKLSSNTITIKVNPVRKGAPSERAEFEKIHEIVWEGLEAPSKLSNGVKVKRK